jgi:hypothetical protein
LLVFDHPAKPLLLIHWFLLSQLNFLFLFPFLFLFRFLILWKVVDNFLNFWAILIFENQIIKTILRTVFCEIPVFFLDDFFLGFVLFGYLSNCRIKPILDLVLGSPLHVLSNLTPGFPKLLVESKHLFIIFISPRSFLNFWTQNIAPSIPTLSPSFIDEKFWRFLPFYRSFFLYPVGKDLIFVVGPKIKKGPWTYEDDE